MRALSKICVHTVGRYLLNIAEVGRLTSLALRGPNVVQRASTSTRFLKRLLKVPDENKN